MVGPLQAEASKNGIPVARVADDAGHNANFIKTATETINGNTTDFLVEPFSDRVFVLVTQSEKMGTLVGIVYCSCQGTNKGDLRLQRSSN